MLHSSRIFHLILQHLMVGCLISSSFVMASPPSLTMSNGQQLEGEIKMIKNKQVELLLPNGKTLTLPLIAFAPSSQKSITTWALDQGGTLKFASWIKSPDRAFSKSWPSSVYGPSSPKVSMNQKESKLRHYVFESDHYRFISDQKLSPVTVAKFATLFETTYSFNMAIPLNVPGRYRKKGHRFTVYLVGSYEKYVRAGGPVGSAGVYMSKQQFVVVPLVSLGVQKRGSRWIYLKGGENMVLVHELTHQLMDGELQAAWYIEGSAEYIATTRYTHAAFHIYGGKQQVFNAVISKKASKIRISRNIGQRVKLQKLKSFMNLTYAQFSRKELANQNYGIALLLTYYFYHIDASGNGHNIKNYIKAIQRGASEPTAQKQLLNGRSYDTVEKAFKKFCAQNGLALEFQ